MSSVKNNKQIVYAILAAIILVGAGALLYSQLGSHNTAATSSNTTVQVATPIQAGFNQDALDQLANPTMTQDFAVQINPSSTLGNANPFGE